MIAPFGTAPDGREVHRIALQGGGLRVGLLTWGATVQDLRLDGVSHPLALGAETLSPYLDPMTHFGALVGRFANRIGHGRFTIDGAEHHTDVNWRTHTLHGGAEGASRQVWEILDHGPDRAVLSLALPDGHMGFPGRIEILATFSLPGEGVLRIAIEARSDAPTPCSIAHHGYFNLDGAADAGDHLLQLFADGALAVDADLIPTGKVLGLRGGPLDFTAPRPVREAALDTCFIAPGEGGMRRMARLTGTTGVTLDVATDAPGLQVYDGSGIFCPEGSGLGGRTYRARAGVALETQGLPDAPNRPEFPDAILRPGEVCRHRVDYAFAAP